MIRVLWTSCVLTAAVSVFLALNYDKVSTSDLILRFGLLRGKPDLDLSCDISNSVTSEEPGVGSCQLKGNVKDCACDFHTVNKVNQQFLYPLIYKLTRTSFFKYFKVNLWCNCPLWPDDGMCVMKSCSVCECEDGEVPKPWIDEENKLHEPCNTTTIERESTVDRTMDAEVVKRLVSLPSWHGFNNPWMPEDDSDVEFSYINLMVNPERYTGYKGENARRVWQAIYSQSCFEETTSPNDHTCAEKRVFYKLISGLHSSITAHVVQEMLIDEDTNTWGPNLDMFKWTLGNPSVSDRVDNLYFTFLFVLRAVTKAGELLKEVEYNTGDQAQDSLTKKLISDLVDMPELKAACPIPFDEGRLWKGDEGPELKAQIQTSFRNITTIMDCVGCEKCKLWGKVQMLGLATTLKVLFHDEDCGSSIASDRLVPQDFILERNEVIALINLLDRLSEGIETYRTMSIMLESRNMNQS